MNSLRRKYTLMALCLAWTSWLNTAAEGPKILCVESDSQIRVESAASGCCNLEASKPPSSTLLGGDGDCDGCDDSTLELVARSRDVTTDQGDAPGSPANTAAKPPLNHASPFRIDLDILLGYTAYFVSPCNPLHVLPGNAPLIC